MTVASNSEIVSSLNRGNGLVSRPGCLVVPLFSNKHKLVLEKEATEY